MPFVFIKPVSVKSIVMLYSPTGCFARGCPRRLLYAVIVSLITATCPFPPLRTQRLIIYYSIILPMVLYDNET
jgi:hypothetical protein